MSAQKLTHGEIAEMAEEYEEKKKWKPTRVIMVLYGEYIGDEKHLSIHSIYTQRLGDILTESNIVSTIIEAEAFIRNVLEE